MVSAPICNPVFCRTCRTLVMERVVGAAAAGAAGGAVGRGAFDPELDMVGGVHKGDEGFGGEIGDSSSDESEWIGGGGDLGRWDDTLVY